MVVVGLEKVAGVAQRLHENVDLTKIFMVSLHMAYDPNFSMVVKKPKLFGEYPNPE